MTLPALDEATLADLVKVASAPDHERWLRQIRATGGCSAPIRLRGWSKILDRTTRQVLHTYATDTEPGGVLRLACGNRRASRCPSCAATYAADTYHLVRAGLVGDDTKGVRAEVREHPRVFATFTAPSFGPVHNRPDTGRCRCGRRHAEDAPELGTPLDPERYDYVGAVLWNNHAGDLWNRFTIQLARTLAERTGIPRSRLREVLRLSYAKVAEFQRRGAVHFHAVIRLDGPEGAEDDPPGWATVELLDDAIRTAAARARLGVPASLAGHPAMAVRWGRQLDVRPVRAFGDGSELTEQAVASYVAKYATKAAESTGTVDRPIGNREALDLLKVPAHARRLIETCLDLDAYYPGRRLAAWAHMLGFRGHFASKSRRYSVTLTSIREERAAYRAAEQRAALGLPDPEEDDTTLTLAHWIYAGQGLTPGESMFAATIANDLRESRRLARENDAGSIGTEGVAA
ncbi:replication initiator protein RepSA [Phaeacidiphilus oryzae]|uniref:replication initiator protein RepSA n=1 Tax=Phaeacidiphilus oryzae TaxID=348818 RepID=UPI00055AC0F9|nr:replication initiator protein RepSA [Phaeacidiphilus oryzae]